MVVGIVAGGKAKGGGVKWRGKEVERRKGDERGR